MDKNRSRISAGPIPRCADAVCDVAGEGRHSGVVTRNSAPDCSAAPAFLAGFDTPLFPMHHEPVFRRAQLGGPTGLDASEAAGRRQAGETSRPTASSEDAIAIRRAAGSSRASVPWLLRVALITLQLAGFWILNVVGFWAVRRMGLPIPGNLVGMLALYALLTLGIVKITWFEMTGSFLIKHLAFFFVPITVGLMNSGPLLLAQGLGITLVLTVSAALGILLAGLVSQTLLGRPVGRGERL